MAAQRPAATGNPFGLMFLFLFYMYFGSLMFNIKVLMLDYKLENGSPKACRYRQPLWVAVFIFMLTSLC